MKKLLTKVNKLKWPHAVIIIAIIAALIGGAAVFGVRQLYQENLKPLNANQQGTESVTIPTGSTLREIANILKDKKIIKSDWAFERYVRKYDASDKIKAGTYELSSSYSVPEIVAIITEGKVATNLLTIIPGKRLDEVKRAFLTSGYSQKTIDDAFNPQNYKDHPALADKPAAASLEGYLYPESFQRTAETEAKTIIKSSLDEMQKRLTPELREAFVRQGLTVHQAVSLASMIEKEVAKPEERPVVAQVFLKRLKSGMKLESDVTAKYAYTVDGKPASLSYDSPYNTYVYAGLPPGPISTVTDTSLKAVAFPASTDWLYFVSGDDDVTYFSKTHEQHRSLVEQHCKKKCSVLP